MFYCLHCNNIHRTEIKQATIFRSGYTLLDNKKVPLGTCKVEKESAVKTQRLMLSF
ncbi:DUF3973 domain-containing protein [Ammoniphilus sp. YIM 78166]|uniref:DUF3973 domain-containing protein n=1 Tax=Ammoniphilus sp. YIM 78166 TaxID=1644106 RepID=UPI001431AAFD